jgi:glycosyltransferase involved in cell wall biosynthesis
MKKLSIIITTYNIEAYINECLETLLPQMTKECELIIVDDCSTDKTKACIDGHKILRKDVAMSVYQTPGNQGVSVARNTGIQYASGEYLTFIDGDDVVSLDYIQEILQALVTGKDYYTLSWESFTGKLRGRADRLHNPAVWCRVYRRAIITHLFDTELSIAEDTKFIRQNLTRALTWEPIMKVLYHYRDGRVGSLTYNFEQEKKNGK